MNLLYIHMKICLDFSLYSWSFKSGLELLFNGTRDLRYSSEWVIEGIFPP